MYELTILNAVDGPAEYLLNIIATQFGAPMFMFCMGITLRFAAKQKPGDYLKRFVQLLTVGMVLNVLRYLPTAYSAARAGEDNILNGWAQIFNVDILQFAGLAMLLIALFKKLGMNHWHILTIGLILNIAGTLLDGHHTDSYVVNQLLGYFYPTPTCCCFPLFNWFIFIAAGNAMGWIYRSHDGGKFLRIAAPIGTVITAVYMYLCLVAESPFTRALQSDWGYYSMHTPDALFTVLGIAPFMLGLFRLISHIIPEKLKSILCYPSRHITQFYCISWVWIMWAANLFLFIPKATTLTGLWIAWTTIIILTTVTVIVYDKYLKASCDAFFSRHATAWYIGIWTALLLFGTWYFSTVPGPYTLPY